MDNKILAKVNGKEITQGMLNSIIKNLPQNQASQFENEDGMKRLLNEIISGELLYLNAVENKFDQREDFILLMEEAKKSLLQRYAVEDLISKVNVSDEEAEEFYKANAAYYANESEVTARHILVDDEEKIENIRKEIEAGLDFSEAALKYSTCPSKNSGGNLGSFSKGKMVPEFEAAAFSIEIGELSKPVKTQFGYHLIIVDAKTEGKASDFSEVKENVKGQLINQKQFEIYNSKINNLKETYSVEII